MPEKYHISDEFTGVYREVLEKAVRASNLPEGINVIKGKEIGKAEKPFIVVTWSPDWREARDAFIAGATNYVSASVDEKVLTKRLSSQS